MSSVGFKRQGINPICISMGALQSSLITKALYRSILDSEESLNAINSIAIDSLVRLFFISSQENSDETVPSALISIVRELTESFLASTDEFNIVLFSSLFFLSLYLKVILF